VEIANTFNDRFSEIGSRIASKLPYHDITEAKSFLKHHISSSIVLEPVSKTEIMNIVNDL